MKRLFIASLLLLAAGPASAISRGCTSAMVTLGLCRTTSDAVMCLAVSTVDPDNGGPKLAPSLLASTAISDNNGWTANMTCTQEMVSVAICNSGQLGLPVPVTRVQFSDMMVRRWVLNQIAVYRSRQEHAAAQVTVDIETPPDVGN